jgi:putative membrane protein
MWHMNAMTGWHLPFMIVYPLLFAGFVTAAVVLLLRTPRPDPPPTDNPHRILAERYARGELTDDEYRARLTTLRQS